MNRRRVGPGVSWEPQLACVQEQRSTGATRRWEERGPATVGALPDPPAADTCVSADRAEKPKIGGRARTLTPTARAATTKGCPTVSDAAGVTFSSLFPLLRWSSPSPCRA